MCKSCIKTSAFVILLDTLFVALRLTAHWTLSILPKLISYFSIFTVKGIRQEKKNPMPFFLVSTDNTSNRHKAELKGFFFLPSIHVLYQIKSVLTGGQCAVAGGHQVPD